MPRRFDRRYAARRLDGTRDNENGDRPVPRGIDRRRRADRCVEEARDIENPE